MRFQRSPALSQVAGDTTPKKQEEAAGKHALVPRVVDGALWCIALAIPISFYLYFARWHSDVALADFKIFYQAALNVRHGRDPFQPALAALQVISTNPVAATGGYFLYPIPFLLFFLPLTFLPLEVAALLWTVLSIFSLVLTVWLLVRLCGKQKWVGLTPLLVIGYSLIGIVHNELKLGQVDLIITFLIVGNYYAYTRKRYTLSGVLLALAIIVKPYLALILLYYLWKRAYRVALASVLTALLCFGVALLVVGWQVNVEWVQVARLVASVPRASQVAVVSLYSLLLRLFAVTLSARPWVELGTGPATIGALILAGVVAILVLRAVRRSNENAETGALEFALWVAGTLLIFPDLEDIHATPAIIALVVVVLTVPWAKVTQSLLASLTVLLVLLYFVNPLLPGWQWVDDVPVVTGWRILETGAYLLGLVLLFSYVLQLLAVRKNLHSQRWEQSIETDI